MMVVLPEPDGAEKRIALRFKGYGLWVVAYGDYLFLKSELPVKDVVECLDCQRFVVPFVLL